jgi:CheY-like chemotaxis protein
VGGALVLLQSLGSATVRKDLAKNPAIRFLAVDDDPISRHAVSMSLKRAFQPPDLAENGEVALRKASSQSYDLIFLDVEMPGMDGFEVCSRIHETELNRHTPVVFVTGHSDFESREKCTASSGGDLIAKPFLSFEITTKALTLILRRRLEENATAIQAEDAVPTPAASSLAEKPSPPPQSFRTGAALSPPQSPVSNSDREPAELQQSEQRFEANTAFAEPNATDFASAFAIHAPQQVRELMDRLAATRQAKDSRDHEDLLTDLYVGIRGLNSEAERVNLDPVRQLTSAVENLIRKLVEKPAQSRESALETAAAALQLLESLCAGAPPELSAAPVRALVVDDDAISRRAIAGALQLTLARPENADSGDRAVALAEAKAFDVIFLDVVMPGMDGFTACCKIRQTGLNAATPIIFVTGQNDAESREKSVRSGGSGFISKPVLPAEIFLTALTFGLRARLEAVVPA